MNRVTTSKVREDLSETLNRVAYGRERVILHRRGKDVAAVVPMEDLRLLEALEDRMDLEDARAAIAETNKKGAKSLRTLLKELGL